MLPCGTAAPAQEGLETGPERTRSWRRPIFPKGCPLSIFGAGELDFRVRDGNGYGLSASVTRILLLDVIGCVRALDVSSAGAEKSDQRSRRCRIFQLDSTSPLTLGQKLKWSSPRPLVPLSFIRHRTSTCGLSNRWSTCGLTRSPGGEPHLQASFALRCFQRLSLPNIATQRCPWRDNWHTSGSSTPVLSY